LQTRHGTSARVSHVLRRARTVVLSAVLLVTASLVVVLVVVPKATGGVPLTVLTGSMKPSIPSGSVVVVRPVDTESLRVGDVITYQVRSGDSTVVTHRIVGISAGAGGLTFRTKGDANDVPDPTPVRAVQIRGKVWYHVPFVGNLANQVDASQRGWATKALAGALLLWSAVLIGGAVRDRIRSGAHEPAPTASAGDADAPPDVARAVDEVGAGRTS